jgi:hypothetical protein
MVNSCAVCGCCTRTDIVREHLEDTLRICDVSAKGLCLQFFFSLTPTWDFALSAMTRAILCQCSLLPTPFRRVLSSRTDVPRVAPTGPFLRIFPWGGIFWKGTFLWDNILEGDSNGWRPRVWPIYYAWMGGVWSLIFEIWIPEMSFPAFWASKFAPKFMLTLLVFEMNKGKNAQKV